MPQVNPLHARRDRGGFNLAFLDIMACGLGAVLLIFLVIKHNTGHGSVETELLLGELETLEQQREMLRQQIKDTTRLNADEQLLGDDLDQRQKAAAEALANVGPIPEPPDRIETQQTGEENYLIGLRVEGQRIAILLDRSASMSHEVLIEIIKAKIGSAADRRAGGKWQRSVRTLKWLLNRAPAESQVAVIEFSETARTLGNPSWFKVSDQAALDRVLAGAGGLTPDGGTNIEAPFALLNGLRPPPTNIYLVTDGLPTQANRTLRCARQRLVSGECRLKLFTQAVKSLTVPVARARFNVVLFPLEGDWDAAPAWWAFAARNSGLLISPAAGWP